MKLTVSRFIVGVLLSGCGTNVATPIVAVPTAATISSTSPPRLSTVIAQLSTITPVATIPNPIATAATVISTSTIVATATPPPTATVRPLTPTSTVVVLPSVVVLPTTIIVVTKPAATAIPQPSPALESVQSFSGLGQNHVPFPVNYPMRPPVGGDHVAVWQNCGIYAEPVIDEQAVHSMEHGAVWIAYQPLLAADTVQRLRGSARGNAYVLMAPYAGLSHPVVLTAWGLQLRLADANDVRIAQFVGKYANGPQTPEKGARCSGGVGSPIEH